MHVGVVRAHVLLVSFSRNKTQESTCMKTTTVRVPDTPRIFQIVMTGAQFERRGGWAMDAASVFRLGRAVGVPREPTTAAPFAEMVSSVGILCLVIHKLSMFSALSRHAHVELWGCCPLLHFSCDCAT